MEEITFPKKITKNKSLLKYFILCYDNDNFILDLNKNDNISTRSEMHDYYSLRDNHVLEHISNNVNKEELSKRAQKRYKLGEKYFSWFKNQEDASLYIEDILIANSDEIQKWCNNRNIYYNDYNYNRLILSKKYEEETGLTFIKGKKGVKSCHNVKVILEYTISHKDGEFAIFTAYPY